ncbi:MAG: DUF421 domain-containing protein [Acidobacteria bacterium]|nr:DUF421 domain-containing protein [Acidobacteriota bacterium]
MLNELLLTGLFDWGWANMFVLDQEKVTYLEKIVRPIVVYGLLILLFRMFGKKEIAQLNPVDFVVLLLISNTVQNAIIGDDMTVTGGFIGVIALLAANRMIALVKFRNPGFEKLLEGSSRTLIKDGKVDEHAIERELMTEEDLKVIANREGYEDVSELDTCVINPNGVIFVEGSTGTKDERFKKEILAKIDLLSKQISELRAELK